MQGKIPHLLIISLVLSTQIAIGAIGTVYIRLPPNE
jgi:hypothetical protein